MRRMICMMFFCSVLTILFIQHPQALATREKMLEFFPEEFLNNLTEEEYNHYATLDFDNATTEEIVVPFDDNDNPTRSTPYSTNYKTLNVTAIPYDSINYAITLTLNWKSMPATRSYDVIALRFSNMAMSNGTQHGYQVYTGGSVAYSYNGTNMKLASNGFGISMNLVNSTSISMLRCFIACDAAKTNSTSTIYGAYEHAKNNVTLAQSKNYSISSGGMGYVINFDSSVWNYYDNMNGVSISV